MDPPSIELQVPGEGSLLECCLGFLVAAFGTNRADQVFRRILDSLRWGDRPTLNVDVQDPRCTKLEQPVLTVLQDTPVMTASVPSHNKSIMIL